MNLPLVDYHCHLDLYPDFERLIIECESKSIHTLAVTTTPRAWPRNFALTKDLKFVRAALGLHPQLITQHANELSVWEKYLQEAKFIGEVGLDASSAFYNSFEVQKAVFEHITKKCSILGGKILSIHSVRSVSQVLNIIEKQRLLENNKAVLHWFSGSLSEAKRAVDMGFYFSVNTEMLSKPRCVDLLNLIPQSRIITETDGPFTSNNGAPQKPENVLLCLNKLASYWKRLPEEVSVIIINNLSNLEELK